MVDHENLPKDEKVGGSIFEELAFGYFAKTYALSKNELLKILKEKQNIDDAIPLSILRTNTLSSLEAIVKFLRENRKLSYSKIAKHLHRNPKTLAVTYAVARRKMPELFAEEVDKDFQSIPFTVFSNRLSILESICTYLKSSCSSYIEISHVIGKDQRTVWTVCRRAEQKIGRVNVFLPKKADIEESAVEELVFEYFEKKYSLSKKDLLKILKDRRDVDNSIPLSILRTFKLSSLESIVKFLRENRELSYVVIGKLLSRNPKTLAVTYAVARRKMSEPFDDSTNEDIIRIPFIAFTRKLSILECICVYLKSQNHSYAEISRMINKDQRTIWTVCHRAESKLMSEDNGR